MKIINLTVFVSTIFIAFAAQAHGGGLNAEGCHNNNKTGDYHCHRAPVAKPAKKPVEPSNATGDPNRHNLLHRASWRYLYDHAKWAEKL